MSAPISPTVTIQDDTKPDVELGVEEKPAISAEPPDGGLDAWLTVLGCSLVALATFGLVNGYGAFNDYYETTYLSNYSPTVISMIGSIQLFILYSCAGVSGPVFDAYGPRLMIPASGLVTVFALCMLSITKPQQIYQQFLTQAILFALGAPFSFLPAMAVCAHWFKRRLAFAIGFPVGSASLGGIIYPVILNRLIPRIGFGWTSPSRPVGPPNPCHPSLKCSRSTHSATCGIRFLCIGGWFTVFSTFNPFFYVGVYGATANGGVTSRLTPYYLSIMCATAIAGRIVPGYIADRVGRFNVVAISTLLSGILILSLWYTSTAEPNLIAFSAIYGFASGPFFSLTTACAAQISPVHEVGARIGMIFVAMSTGAFAGTPIGGVFIRQTTVPHFRQLILFSGIMALVGVVLFLGCTVDAVSKDLRGCITLNKQYNVV
ncbi:Monocarboxylate permease-like protein [Mycena sanguinolenta]|uniref:Monocarboxylate permease-like protein n=1 Tax=Mycena sanguinolenta TaxID=230812 RepID=A0A8H6XUZ6_9AGAR|nr:Monocarboxylate permease-like protein [Mycena sanguinolenta]